MTRAHRLPKVLATFVVRTATRGEVHGGVYRVDLESARFDLVVRWDDRHIDWEGRGGARGLRGVAIDGPDIYVAASDEILLFDSGFQLRRSFSNKYLKHAHEIAVAESRLYVTSTAYDSVLELDLRTGRFTRGVCIRRGESGGVGFELFDPNSVDGPVPGDTTHLNSICHLGRATYIAGATLPFLLALEKEELRIWSGIPLRSHNARPYREGVILNDSAAGRLLVLDPFGSEAASLRVRRHEPCRLIGGDLPAEETAQGFTRGLCVLDNDDLVAVGSSPASIWVYAVSEARCVREVVLSTDVRHSIHGLAVWPE